MNELKSNEKRAKNAILLIWIIFGNYLLIVLIATISTMLFTVWLPYLEENSTLSFLSNLCDKAIVYADYLTIALFIISAFTFILWFRRAYYNLRLFSGITELGDGWAAGAWFVPIMNLVVPYQIMKELYTKTDKYLLIENTDEYENKRLRISTVNWWWTIWITTKISEKATKWISKFSNLDTTDDALIYSLFSFLFLLLNLALCIVTIKVIKNYAEAEKLIATTYTQREPSLGT